MARNLWTRVQQMHALELYLRTPFGRIHNRNPEIIDLANNIGRTPSALSLKMVNFAALDPTLPQKGMGNYSKSDALLWEEFFASPTTFLSLIPDASKFTGDSLPPNTEIPLEDESVFAVREGQDVFRQTKVRLNQSSFRKMLLASYEGKCALTDIADSRLLIASHIKPWSKDPESRMDPRNGILLNALHDRAFDAGHITFEDDLSLRVSRHLSLPDMAKPFFDVPALKPPARFAPAPEFLKHHRDHEFEKFP